MREQLPRARGPTTRTRRQAAIRKETQEATGTQEATEQDNKSARGQTQLKSKRLEEDNKKQQLQEAIIKRQEAIRVN